MSKITRATQQIFGSTGNVGTGGFGAAAAGNVATEVATISTLSTLQGLAAWAQGWISATLGTSKFPAIEDMNAVNYVLTTQMAYVLQQGIPEYDAGTTYYIGSVCMNPGTTQLYKSLTDNNVGNALSTISDWLYCGDLSVSRIPLTTNTTYYVATTGSDSNNGSSSSPWLTIQHAINYVQDNVDLNGFTVTISVGNGTYTGAITVSNGFTGYGLVLLQGNIGSPSSCILSTTSANAITTSNGAQIDIQGFEIQTTTSGHALCAQSNSIITIAGEMTFAGVASGSYHMNADNGIINLASNYTISGNATAHFETNNFGSIRVLVALTVTLSGTPAFTDFAFAQNLSCINVPLLTFSGSATGARYSAVTNSVIETNGSGSTYLPGDSGGSTATGGQYA